MPLSRCPEQMSEQLSIMDTVSLGSAQCLGRLRVQRTENTMTQSTGCLLQDNGYHRPGDVCGGPPFEEEDVCLLRRVGLSGCSVDTKEPLYILSSTSRAASRTSNKHQRSSLIFTSFSCAEKPSVVALLTGGRALRGTAKRRVCTRPPIPSVIRDEARTRRVLIPSRISAACGLSILQTLSDGLSVGVKGKPCTE